jgi:hypothetical protein
MAKKKDLVDLGDVYSKLGEEVVVSEKNDMTVGDKDMTVGEAPLEDGGDCDAECETPKELKAEEAPEVKEEDEEVTISEEDEENALKDAQGGINNYMAKKSAFDTLFAKVISEDFGMDEQDDLNALGIEDATPDAELGEEGDDDASEEEITVTLDKELAKTLCDLLQAAMGEEETDEAGDEDVADELESPEEDNEGEYKAHTAHVDMGTNNKVGHVDGLGGEGKGTADGGKSADQTKLGDKHVGDQKVNAKLEAPTTKVTPKNKEVKAG